MVKIEREYGVQTTIVFTLWETDGTALKTDATFAAGDVVLMRDEAAEANATNLPTDEGRGYSLVLTAAEMQAARIVIYIVDQDASKTWLDREIVVETYGNASAQHTQEVISLAEIQQECEDALAVYDAATAADLATGVNVTSISGDATAADNLEAALDGTGGVVLSLRRLVVANTTAGETAVDIEATGTGNAHAMRLQSTNGHGLAAGSTNANAINAASTSADAVSIAGGTNSDGLQVAGNGTGVDVRANITGNLTGNVSGSVGSITGMDAAALQQIVDDLEDAGRLDLLIDAIKAKTDSLTFTQAGQVDANVQSINDVALTGDGSVTPFGV